LQSSQQVEELLCKKWKPTSGLKNGNEFIVTIAAITEFQKGGVLILYTTPVENGKWDYDPITRTLEMTSKGGQTRYTLVELTSEKMLDEELHISSFTKWTYKRANYPLDGL
jgi:hypothetical protein